MTRIAINGVHLNALTAGAGRPLVLLHGFTGSASTWEPFLPAFGRVRSVVAIDLLGHGLSESPRDAERYRIERCVEDLTDLFKTLEIREYDLLGYSMGGRVALHLALAHGERVGALILESTSPGIQGSEERAARVRQDEALATMLEEEGIERFVDHWENLPIFSTQARLSPALRAQVREERLASDPAGLAGSLRGFGAGVPEPLFDRLGELRAPLIIAGALDEKYCRLAQMMGQTIPHARIEIVEDAGHAVHLERPEAFGEIVMDFLQEDTNDAPHRYGDGTRKRPSAVQMITS